MDWFLLNTSLYRTDGKTDRGQETGFEFFGDIFCHSRNIGSDC